MKVPQNSDGLYAIPVKVQGKKKEKTLKALIDTGSTDCVCTYPVITTLQIKPIDFVKVNSLDKTQRRLIYAVNVGFDGSRELVPVVRVAELKGGAEFIIGMSVLRFCKFEYSNGFMELTWNK